ncbi:hypothetical protein M422DRAFT_775394 [Sphaerobolus stellatus SS14]|nr:hypothetical protein M422DRAFT_775394 [Sphaerobolus stellatus SS14]
MALEKVALVSMFIESAIWGLQVPLFPLTVFLLVRKPSELVKHIPHLVIVTVVLVLCFVHLLLSFLRSSHGLVDELNPDAYLRNITDVLYRAKYGVLFVVLFIGDIIITSRCFAIWNNNYFVGAIPAMLSVATLVCASGVLHSLVDISNSGRTVDATVQNWFIATYVLALATKLICAGLVVWRVRQIHSEITKNVNRHVKIYTALFVLVESGGLACLVTSIVVPLAITDIDEHILFCDILSPITGIAIMLIIAGRAVEFSNSTSAVVAAHAVLRQSIPPNRPKISTRVKPAPTNRWDDFDDMKGSPGSAPSIASSPEYEGINKSSGTLNMAIVI